VIKTAAEFLTGMLFVLVFVLLERRSALATQRAESLVKDLQAANIALKAAHQKEKELAHCRGTHAPCARCSGVPPVEPGSNLFLPSTLSDGSSSPETNIVSI
jgi:hypothetical protein